jgi:hypothetical protein
MTRAALLLALLSWHRRHATWPTGAQMAEATGQPLWDVLRVAHTAVQLGEVQPQGATLTLTVAGCYAASALQAREDAEWVRRMRGGR